MKSTVGILIVGLVLIIGLSTYFVFFHTGDRTAYFYNQKVFDQFKGKVELESRLNNEVESSRKNLDSLRLLIENGRKDLSSLYHEQLQQATTNHQELSERYTADIWKYINQEVSSFGRENGYDYIFGASGNGSLMYADSTHDITAEIVRYLNQKYSDQ